MNKSTYVLIVALALFLVGCPARSVFPLFADKDLAFNPALVGVWVDAAQKNSFTFEQSGNKAYRVIVNEADEPGKHGERATYTLHLGRIGKHWFLDSYPADDSRDHHFVATHIISKIQLKGDTLSMSSLESDRLRDLIDSRKLRVTHARRGGEILLTANTAELQKVIQRLAEDLKAFGEPSRLVRAK